jgi:multicomponent Na+:H+ antiporter subunit B
MLFLAALAVLAPLGIVALMGLAPFGHYPGPYGDLINARGVSERHVTNMVTAVNFDYRGFDTLGEEYILFAAVTGIAMLLRGGRGTHPESPPGGGVPHVGSEAIIGGSRWFVAFLALFGFYIVLHAHQTPGGGFQGGAILGTATLLLYFGEGYAGWRRLTPHALLDVAKAAGAGAYAVFGFAAMIAGGAFLQNFLPLGKAGNLLSGGTILPINIAVGLEVAAGFALLFSEFLEETRQALPGDER